MSSNGLLTQFVACIWSTSCNRVFILQRKNSTIKGDTVCQQPRVW